MNRLLREIVSSSFTVFESRDLNLAKPSGELLIARCTFPRGDAPLLSRGMLQSKPLNVVQLVCSGVPIFVRPADSSALPSFFKP